MNNEEKILDLLTKLTEKVDNVDGRLDRVEAAQAEMQATQAKQGEQLTRLEGKVEKLESNQAEMQETLTRVAVTQEGVVLPRIQMLFDGHNELKRELDTLATKEQVEELAADVDVIKTVVTRHSGEISKLKKAQ